MRIPLTAKPTLFVRAVELGRTVVWLHTFGERFVDPKAGRPKGPPRFKNGDGPQVTKAGKIPSDPDCMPDEMGYDETRNRLLVGTGFVENVPPEVWRYDVSGKRVLTQWFSYRRKTRERPIIGDRRPPSKLGELQPDHWIAEYTTELINVLNVLSWLVKLEPDQARILEEICDESTLGFQR